MTNTAKTYYIALSGKNMNDVEVMEYWLSLSDSDKALFDNVSDFLTTVSLVIL